MAWIRAPGGCPERALLIVGDADTIVPTASNGQLMYNAIRSPRQVANIRGGSHCGFIDANAIGCDAASLARADQLLAARRLLTSWFSLYLKDAHVAWRSIWGPDSPIDARVVLTFDPCMSLAPRTMTGVVQPQDAVRFDLQLRNADDSAADIILAVEDASGAPPSWNATVVPAVVRALPAGATVPLTLDVRAPSTGTTDLFVTARTAADGGTIAWASITLSVACAADFNLDGGIDGSDIGAFFLAWSGGDAAADINADGGVDGGDVESFFRLWEAGGC